MVSKTFHNAMHEFTKAAKYRTVGAKYRTVGFYTDLRRKTMSVGMTKPRSRTT